MKKILSIGLAITAILTSCSSDNCVEIASTTPKSIDFGCYIDKNINSRADGEGSDPRAAVSGDIITDNLNSFQVWGLMENGERALINIFEGKNVTMNAAGEWVYDNPQYWQNNYKYSFVAIAPNNGNWSYTMPNDIGDFGNVVFNNDFATDLIIARDNTYATTPITFSDNDMVPPIKFTFHHMLSRIIFGFRNNMDDGSKIYVKNVKITNAYTSGKLTDADASGSATWAFGDATGFTATTGEMDFGDVILQEGETPESGYANVTNNATRATKQMYMIPATGDNTKTYLVSFEIVRYNNTLQDTYIHTDVVVPAPGDGWKNGYSYYFRAEIGPKTIDPDSELKPIQFDIDIVKSWGSYIPTIFEGVDPTTTENNK